MYEELAVLAVFTFLYSVVSGRLEKLPVSGPIIFVLVGLALGPLGLGWFIDDVGRIELKALVDITLALVLFLDASTADQSVIRRFLAIPTRMLLLGLPGAIALGTALAVVMFGGLSIFEAAILGTMLAATDAALGKAVVTNPAVPARLREGLNIESGLNDGLCVPFLLVFIALAHGAAEPASELGIRLVAEELGIGALVGVSLGAAGALLLRRYMHKGWVSEVWIQVSVPALAISALAVAQSLHGSGYIAAFVGGLVFGHLSKDATHKLVMPGEGISEALGMLTWLVFGVGVIGQNMAYFTWPIVIYAILSLTVVRMVPIFISLMGTGESVSSRLFLGWFGPRGLATIVFGIMVLNENLPSGHTIAMIVSATVGLSLLLHGITANPLARWIAGKERGGSPGGSSATWGE